MLSYIVSVSLFVHQTYICSQDSLEHFCLSILQNWCNWPDESFEEMDSTLAVQQFIQQLIAKDASCVDEILTPPDGQDEGVWKYEHLRYPQKLLLLF